MAKTMKFEDRRKIEIVARLDKDENGEFILVVEEKEGQSSFKLKPILETMCGELISLSSDIYQ